MWLFKTFAIYMATVSIGIENSGGGGGIGLVGAVASALDDTGIGMVSVEERCCPIPYSASDPR